MFNPPKLHKHDFNGFMTMIATLIETTFVGGGVGGRGRDRGGGGGGGGRYSAGGSGGENVTDGMDDDDDVDGGGGLGTLDNYTVKQAMDVLFENQLNADKVLVLYLEMAIVVAYAVLFVIGLVSNGLVCFVVFRQCGKKNVPSQGPSPRNLYIVNLAFADIIMCVVCMPFTLWALMSRRWTWGLIMCKTVPAAQGANITVSACTITAIALDR